MRTMSPIEASVETPSLQDRTKVFQLKANPYNASPHQTRNSLQSIVARTQRSANFNMIPGGAISFANMLKDLQIEKQKEAARNTLRQENGRTESIHQFVNRIESMLLIESRKWLRGA